MNADLLNKAGGLTVGGKTYKIEYHIYDNKAQADVARAAIERLVFQDKIKFDVGTFHTASLLAMLAVTEPNKIPVFGCTGSDKLLSPEYKYFVRTYSGAFAMVNGRYYMSCDQILRQVFKSLTTMRPVTLCLTMWRKVTNVMG